MTVVSNQHEMQEDPPVAPMPKKAIVFVAVLSTIAGFVVQAQQVQVLGDVPGVMLICGWVLAFATGVLRLGHCLFFGAAAMAGFFITAGVDLILNGGHNLLPIEFGFYAFYALSAVVVAFLTGLLASRLFGAPEG